MRRQSCLLHPPAQLQEDAPDGLLGEGRVKALALGDVVAEVTEWCILHHNAQLIAIQEGLVVPDLQSRRGEMAA